MRSTPSLPPPVVRALEAVRRRRRALALLEAVCWAGLGLGSLVLLAPLAAEVAVPAPVRWLARAWAAAWVVVPIVLFVVPPWRRTGSPLQLARAVDDRVPETADSLLAAVDLAAALDDERIDDPTSRHLARDHIHMAAERAAEVDARSLLPLSRLGRRSLIGPLVAAAAGVVALVLPDPTTAGLGALLGAPLPGAEGVADAEGKADEEATLVLRNLRLVLEPPAYSGRETLELDGTTGDFRALPGTRVALRADLPSGGTEVSVAWLSGPEPPRWTAPVDGDAAEISFVVPGGGEYRVEVARGPVRDTLRSRRMRVEALPDDPPDLEVTGPGGELTVRPSESISLSVRTRDDFGLSRVDLAVVSKGKVLLRTPITDPGALVGRTEFEEQLGWSPDALDGAGGEVELVVESWDNDTVNGPKVTRSRPIEVWVPTPADHHRRVLAAKQKLLDQCLDLLAAVLVSVPNSVDQGREELITEHEHAHRLAQGVFTTAADLSASMVDDPFERRQVWLGLGQAIENLARRWSDVDQAVRERIESTDQPWVDRSALVLLTSRRQLAIDELERLVLDLGAFIDLQIGEELAGQLDSLEPDLADLADLIRQSQDGKPVDDRIKQKLDELARQLAEIAQQMADRSRGPDDGFANQMPQELGEDALSEISRLLAEGKEDEALQKLQEAMDALAEMREALQQESEQMAGGQNAQQLQRELQAGIDEARRLEQEQQEVIDATDDLQERFGSGDPMSDAEREQLSADIRRLQELIAELPPDELPAAARAAAGQWTRLADRQARRLEESFEGGSVDQAIEEASAVGGYLDEAGRELRAASGGSPEALLQGRREADEAAALAYDIAGRLAQADARARRSRSRAAAASAGTQQQQQQVGEGVGQLQEQMEAMGGSAFNPVAGRQRLEQAQQMMQGAEGRLAQGRTGPALASEQDALRQLQAFRESLEQAQQAMQSGQQRMGSGQPSAGGPGGQQSPWGRADDFGRDGWDKRGDVEMSDPDDFVTPEAFRALIQEEASGDAPERYRPMNGSYYEELIK